MDQLVFYKKFIKLIESNPDIQLKYNIIINLAWNFNLLENLKGFIFN